MRCEIAREAISARMDGETEGVPSKRVDEHLEHCPDCCAWYIRADHDVAELTRISTQRAPDLSALILSRAGIAPQTRFRRTMSEFGRNWARIGLTICGCAQVGVAMSQMTGYHYGMIGQSQMISDSAHLMNETTAWSLALGVVMIVAAWWRRAIDGLLIVLAIFTVMLAGYVIHDAMESAVTAARIASHLPVLMGLFCVVAAVRQRPHPRPPHYALNPRPAPDSAASHDSAA